MIQNQAAHPLFRLVLVSALLLMVPLVAMQFTDEVVWSLSDFVFAGAMFIGTGLLYRALTQTARSTLYRTATGVGIAAAFLLVWSNLAVGIIGNENDPANGMYVGVLLVALLGAILARLRPGGMALAMAAAAMAQAAITAFAIVKGLGYPESGPLELVGVNGLFIAIWLTSAALFRETKRRGDSSEV